MPIRHWIDDRLDIRRHAVDGEVTYAEVVELLRELYDRPGFRADQSVLWDLRTADLEPISPDEIRRLASFVQRHWGREGHPRAALVVASDFGFGMARMYELCIDGSPEQRVRVFRDMEEAEHWISSGSRKFGAA